VRNATAGVNAVLRSLELGPEDEVLVSDHEYNASRNALDFVAGRAGARVVTVSLPFPLQDPGQVLEAFLGSVTPRTRLALVDHVTSQTGLVLPLAELVQALRERGVETLVDGAHGPGMRPLALEDLGAAFYTGNAHKWICAPKGAALLYVRPDWQERIRPTSISHGANTRRAGRSRFHDEFDWTGTEDPTPWLCVPRALEVMGGLFPGGWEELRRRNRELVLEGRAVLCEALGLTPPAPESMIGSLASVPLPDGRPREGPAGALYDDPLQDLLREEHRIQVPVIPWPAAPRRLLRISAQAYNRPEQYHRLAGILHELLASARG